MSMPKAGVSLVVENDQQFKAALSEVNAGLKVNKQQMQLVTEQTREMDDRQAALKQRYESVQQTLQSYRDKVQVLQQAYENSARREGESSKTTMQWRASLISAQTEVAKQENLLKELSDQQERTNKTTASLADVVNGLANALGISLPPGLQTAVDKLDGFSASGAAAVTVVGGLAGALASSTMDMSKTADDLLTLSTQTSLTTDQLQEFEYASELVDVSTDTLRGSLVKLTNNMQTAATGTGSAAEAFKTLKVKVADSQGHLKNNYDVFLQTIDALGKIKNETERDALAMDIFGRSATDLNPLIEAGSGRLKELAGQAHEVGYVVDNETLQSFGELDDAMQKLDKQGDAVKRSFAEALLPIITAFAEALSAIPTPVLTAVISITSIATVVLAETARPIHLAMVRHPSTWILPHGQAAAVFDGACRLEHTGPERWRKAPPIPCRWQTPAPRWTTCAPPARHTTALTQYSAGRSPAALPAARSAVHCSRDPLFCSTGLTTWLTRQILQASAMAQPM